MRFALCDSLYDLRLALYTLRSKGYALLYACPPKVELYRRQACPPKISIVGGGYLPSLAKQSA